MESVYRHELVVGPEVVDGNGQVNNVAYVQWMQDAAIAQSMAGGSPTVMGIEAQGGGRDSLVGVDELASILRDRNNLIHLQEISKAINSESDPDRLFEKIIDSAESGDSEES